MPKQPPLKAFKGDIERYRKCCVIEAGKIVRMYWAHSTGDQEIDVAEVLAKWVLMNPDRDPATFIDQRWLSSKGFLRKNVIRDGVRKGD